MVTIENPLDTPFARMRVTLDGAEYELRLEYNQRSGWYVGLSAPDGTVLFHPRKAQPFVNLLDGTVTTKAPPGSLALVPLDEADTSKPALADLGRTHFIAYFTAEDVANA